LTLGSAWTAVLAVGIRPCSGAVIVLVFALAQGLFIAGIGATFAMSLGTAITVSALSALAVAARRGAARDFAVRITRGSDRFGVALRMIEITAALAVSALGLLLLGGALSN
jgi:nickel/cobalt exporter